jgi:hypothetical protein
MKRMDQINVIPFIDVMLVLLAIVLTTATFLIEGRLPIRLPAAETQTTPWMSRPSRLPLPPTARSSGVTRRWGWDRRRSPAWSPDSTNWPRGLPSCCGWMPRPASRPSSGSSIASRPAGSNG